MNGDPKSDKQEPKGQPTSEQIIRALEKSGYLFENKIARMAESLGYHVESNWAFEDPDESTSREVDIRAFRRIESENKFLQVNIEMLIECKNSDSPIVFLKTPKNKRELDYPQPIEYIFPVKKYRRRIAPTLSQEVGGFTRFALSKSHYYYREGNKHTQFAKIVRKSSDWHANHDGIYDSLIIPQVKAIENRLAEVNKHLPFRDRTTVWLFFNVIVLRDHLFSVDLSGTALEPTPEGRVSFVRHIRSRTLDGYYLTDFVTEGYFANFAQEVQSFADSILEIGVTQLTTQEYSEN